MRKTRFILITVVVLLSLVLVSAALADSRSGDSGNPGEPPGQATPPVETQTDSHSEDTGNPDGSSEQENPQIDTQPSPQSGYGPESLSGSLVTFDPSVGGDDYYHPGLNQTFCFKAESYTDDNEWVETLCSVSRMIGTSAMSMWKARQHAIWAGLLALLVGAMLVAA